MRIWIYDELADTEPDGNSTWVSDKECREALQEKILEILKQDKEIERLRKEVEKLKGKNKKLHDKVCFLQYHEWAH